MSLSIHLTATRPTEVFWANYTHNCNTMAKEAGIYMQVWRPEEVGITKASELIPHLEAGIALMESDPPRFEALNPENGWGSYKTFVPWLKKYLEACRENPDATIEVSR